MFGPSTWIICIIKEAIWVKLGDVVLNQSSLFPFLFLLFVPVLFSFVTVPENYYYVSCYLLIFFDRSYLLIFIAFVVILWCLSFVTKLPRVSCFLYLTLYLFIYMFYVHVWFKFISCSLFAWGTPRNKLSVLSLRFRKLPETKISLHYGQLFYVVFEKSRSTVCLSSLVILNEIIISHHPLLTDLETVITFSQFQLMKLKFCLDPNEYFLLHPLLEYRSCYRWG